MVTTSRGAGNTLAMTEYAVAGILYFANGLNRGRHRSGRRPGEIRRTVYHGAAGPEQSDCADRIVPISVLGT
jgi:hypothetical protein